VICAIGRFDLVRAQAEPAHAGVDTDCGQAPLEPVRQGDVSLELSGMVQDRDQPGVDRLRLGAGRQSVQNMDSGLRQAPAQPEALTQMGDEEALAALVPQRARDLDRAPRP
jgi:hypothetical protein